MNVKIGDPIPEKRPPSYELDILKHVQAVDPKNYGAKGILIDPIQYFITSGDAVSKTKALLKDFTKAASESKGKYATALKKAVKLTQELVVNLELARGDACFLETEWDNHVLFVIPKNPRDKTPQV